MFLKILLLIICLLPPCSYSKDLVVFLSPKQTQFTIELKSNPTTGYRWNIKSYSKTLFILQSSTYKQSQPMLIGSGGYQKFVFLVQHPEVNVDEWISFKYDRPWEKKSGLLQRVHVITK